MLRVLHTSDWHLGQRLHEQSREYEHQCFLDWLLEQLQEQQVDALIVCGDIFDSANPPVSALRQFYAFITAARQALPDLQMLFIGGNHDSPGRLESARPLLSLLNVHVIGAIRVQQHELVADPLLIPLRNRAGEVEVLCAAMPYLRPVDLPRVVDDVKDGLVEAVRHRYRELFAAARQVQQAGQALLATGHCYMVKGQLSELSERRILGGNQHALPLDIFPPDLAYGALGHLHLAQELEDNLRYSGSPIPLSLAEKDYPHQVLLVDFDQGRREKITELRVPRWVEILCLPASGPDDPQTLCHVLEQLVLDEQLPPERHPYLELQVQLSRPEPGLWERFRQLLEDRPVRLLKLSVSHAGRNGALSDREGLPPELEQLEPETVFRLRYQEQYEAETPDELVARFHELLQQVQETES